MSGDERPANDEPQSPHRHGSPPYESPPEDRAGGDEEIIDATLVSGPPAANWGTAASQDAAASEDAAASWGAAARDTEATRARGETANEAGTFPFHQNAAAFEQSATLDSLPQAIERSPWLSVTVIVGVMGTATVAYLLTSAFAMIVALWAIGEFPPDPASGPDAMTRVMQDRVGIFLAILPPQLALIVFPIAASFLLPEGPRRGLRLVRGRWPVWVWLAAAAATPLVGMLSSILVSGFAAESEALEMFSETFRVHGRAGFLLPIALLIGVTPAVCEELLFRGFLQPRLTRLIPPGLGIFLASLAFAAYHLDPVHVIAVFPLGLWLGFLSYRSGSLFPAMIGHFVNNVLSVIGVMAEETGALDVPEAWMAVPILVLGGLGLLVVTYASFRWRVAPASG